MFRSWWSTLVTKPASQAAARCRSRRPRCTPHLETLELRMAPAVFTVNSLADTIAANLATGQDTFGNITLRSAIQAANNVQGPSNSINPPAGKYNLTIGGLNVYATVVIAGVTITGGNPVEGAGGGIYNRLLVSHLEAHFNKKLRTTSALDVNPDAKEAVLFALLANEAVAGERTTSSYNFPQVSMGKISFPY